MPEIALEVSGLTKRYVIDDQTVLANDAIELEVESGSLHAVVGENGAGKSTLAHILSGMTTPDAGKVEIFGRPLPFGDPLGSRSFGLGLVAQHFTLVDTLTVWENVALGNEPVTAGWIDRDVARSRVERVADSISLDVSPDDVVGDLSLPLRQGVEIVKALSGDTRLLILDEPTSVLGPEESAGLFERIEGLRAQGTTIILVTHRMREVTDHATACTVLRDGKSVATFARDEFDEGRIVEAIIGRPESQPLKPTRPPESGGNSIRLSDVTLKVGGRPILDELQLEVRGGEILGLAGVAGNGQTELCDVIAGLRQIDQGSIEIAGEIVTSEDARRRREAGLVYIPSDRRNSALVEDFSVRDNLFLGRHHSFGSWWNWNRDRTESAAADLIRSYDIRTPSAIIPVGSLSGGNQQKVVIARELSREPRAILAVHPTQGLDLGATRFVHDRLVESKENGCGTLILSNDLDELRTICDRIAVIYRGKIVGICGVDAYDEATVGSWMTSGS